MVTGSLSSFFKFIRTKSPSLTLISSPGIVPLYVQALIILFPPRSHCDSLATMSNSFIFLSCSGDGISLMLILPSLELSDYF